MTAEDDMPWWVVRRGADDEAAFVDEVSGALYAPGAAPEIRMFAEVMAVLDIPSQPRGLTVSQRLAEERERLEAANVIPLRRLAFVRSVAAIAVAAAIALGLVTVSAYAGVLPDGIQKVAHSVINAPSPKHSNASPGDGKSNDPKNGGVAPGTASTQTGANGSASNGQTNGATPTTSKTPGATNSDGSTPTNTPPTGPGANNGNGSGNHGHKSTPPPTSTAPSDSASPPVGKHHG